MTTVRERVTHLRRGDGPACAWVRPTRRPRYKLSDSADKVTCQPCLRVLKRRQAVKEAMRAWFSMKGVA